jgi:hypothetical protein
MYSALHSMQRPRSPATHRRRSSALRHLLADTETFLLRWGADAAALGWELLDLFGVHREALSPVITSWAWWFC